jgi:hypothetical protein
MANKLLEQLEAFMPPTMQVPVPIKMLYEWIESRNLFTDTEEGKRIGFLYPEKSLEQVGQMMDELVGLLLNSWPQTVIIGLVQSMID